MLNFVIYLPNKLNSNILLVITLSFKMFNKGQKIVVIFHYNILSVALPEKLEK